MRLQINNPLRTIITLATALLLGLYASGPVAILVGIAFAVTIGTPTWSPQAAQRVLAVSVVGLGAGMNMAEVARIGLNGLLLTAITLSATVAVGLWLGRRLNLSRNVATLITVGTAICGGSAIAAVAPLLKARASDIAASLGVVFMLNAVALYVFPPIGRMLQMDPENYGLWCAFAIHDTSSVVGAAAAFGPQALATATITKLSRALWIVPVSLSMSFLVRAGKPDEEQGARVRIPVFIWAFVLMVLLVTGVPTLRPVGQQVAQIARHGMVVALFFVGLALNPATLRQVSGRALAFGGIMWGLLAAGTLAYFS